jgi:hypothetical protein
MALRTTSGLAACVALGCGNSEGPAASEGGPASSEGGDGAGASATVGTGAATSTGSAWDLRLHASLLSETEPGQGPALIDLVHATSHFVTLELGGALFYKIGATEEATPQLAASADIKGNVKIGYCDVKDTETPCIFVTLGAFAGPNVLIPGASYEMRVAEDVAKAAWSLEVVEVAGPSFRALRAQAGDFESGARRIEVTLARGGVVLGFDLPLIAVATPYARLEGARSSMASVGYVGTKGDTYSGALRAAFEGGSGFTILVDKTPHPNALGSTELDPPFIF